MGPRLLLHPLPSNPPPPSSSTRTAPSPSLSAAAALHAHLLRRNDPNLSRHVLPLYCASGWLAPACSLLRLTPRETLAPFHYNTLIRAHTDSSLHDHAVALFLEMQAVGLPANEFTYPFALKSCSALGHVGLATQIHSAISKTGLLCSNVFAATALLDVYAKWGALEDACKLFDIIPDRNAVAWNAVVSAFAQNGLYEEALEMLELMEDVGVGGRGEVSSWNAVVAGCVRRGDDAESALRLLGMMVDKVKPNPATFNTLLPAIPAVGSVSLIRELHCYALRHLQLVRMDPVHEERLQSALASGYALNGHLEYALTLFNKVRLKNCQLWNSIISGFVTLGEIPRAFDLFRELARNYGQELRRSLSKVSLTLLLPECDPLSKSGLEIHAYAYRNGLDAYPSVNNALIAMYSKRGDVARCELMFERAKGKDVVTWNTMVSCYATYDDYDRAFDLFCKMLSEGVRPDEFSFGSVLNGCGHSAFLMQGKALHCQIIKGRFSASNCVLQNAIMDMYGKCGCIQDSRRIFDGVKSKDNISWNTIISSYAFNACPHEAFVLFEEMKEEGQRPNRVTFIALLSACSHAGLLEQGLHCFESMCKEHGIVPDVDHYSCIVDNLSRAGQLDYAYQLIQNMPVEPDDCIWGALLGGCRLHGNISLAEIAGRHLVEMAPKHSGYRVLLSNVYKDASRWENVAQVWSAMKDDRVRKIPGYSWIELGSGVHKFFTADKSHQNCKDIYEMLHILMMELRGEGYVPPSNSRFNFSDQERIGV